MFDFHKEEEKYSEPTLVKKFETIDNPDGIGNVYSYKKRNVVILPGTTETSIQIYDSNTAETSEYDVGVKPSIVAANIHGEVFAFVDVTGTDIKLHHLKDGTFYKSFTRGKEHVKVTSIVFHKFCIRMALVSTKETVHVFSLPKELALNDMTEEELKEELGKQIKKSYDSEEQEDVNSKSLPASLLESRVNQRAGFFGTYVLGTTGEYSYLKVYINCPNKSCTIVGDKLKIITSEGNLYSISIQCEGSVYENSQELSCVSVLKPKEEKEK